MSITLVFMKNSKFWQKKSPQTDKNIDHNIDPWSLCLVPELEALMELEWAQTDAGQFLPDPLKSSAFAKASRATNPRVSLSRPAK
jgi:hypothetical protein